MNEQNKYQLIAAKLELLPVPDMADKIWARIEAQLDIDLPPDDGNNDPGPAPTPKPVGKRIAWGVVTIVILITTFQVYKIKNEDHQLPSVIPVPQKTNSINFDTAVPFTKPPFDRTSTNSNQPSSPPAELLTTPAEKTDSNIVIQQSGAKPKVPGSYNDTIPLVNPTVVLKPSGDTIPIKKRRGVALDQSDYRIVPKN
jgi:hypothetical protein